MEKFRLHGNLKKTPFAFLLFRIWKSKRSGSLKLQSQTGKKSIEFLGGNLSPTIRAFPAHDFLHQLASQHKIKDKQIQIILKNAESTGFSPVRTLLDKEIYSPCLLWKDMHLYFELDLFPVFDWTDAEFFFDSDSESKRRAPLFLIDTPVFILNGIREMTNIPLMDTHIASQEKCSLQPSEHIRTLPWNSPENYIIRLIQTESSLSEIYKNSELGLNETSRMLFALRAMEMIGEIKKAAPSPDIGSAEIQRIFEHFNRMYAQVFKYLAKEMGPVAFKVLEKCIMDVKPHLPSVFQTIRLESTGRLIFGSASVTPAKLPREMNRKDYLSGLNEILNAEILLIKKTLGSESEASLIKTLNSIPA